MNYNDYNPFGSPNCLQQESRKQKASDDDDDDYLSNASSRQQQYADQLQELLDKLISNDDYDPIDPSQRWLKSRLRKGLKDYVTDNDYDSFAVFDHPQQPRKRKAPPITYDDDDLFGASPRNQQHVKYYHAPLKGEAPTQVYQLSKRNIISSP